MGERSAPSLLHKKKRGSAKSDISKVLFPGIGKITNMVSLSFSVLTRKNYCKI